MVVLFVHESFINEPEPGLASLKTDGTRAMLGRPEDLVHPDGAVMLPLVVAFPHVRPRVMEHLVSPLEDDFRVTGTVASNRVEW